MYGSEEMTRSRMVLNNILVDNPEISDVLNKGGRDLEYMVVIELVKKYAIDKGIDFKPEKLSDFFDIAATDNFKNDVAKTLNIVTYESILKHTLYNNLRETNNFSLKENSAAGWIEKAINLNAGEVSYFIDIEGGPDNKPFPVVSVISKKNNVETKHDKLVDNNHNDSDNDSDND